MDIRARLRKLLRGGEIDALAVPPPRLGLDAEAQRKFLAQFEPDGARWLGAVAPYIGEYAKRPVCTEERGSYSVYLVNRGPSCYGVTRNDINFNVIYFDATRAAVLCKGYLALAVVSFQLRPIAKNIDGSYAMIVQLQGATLSERADGRHDERRLELAKLKWERLLVAFLRDQLFANGFDELNIKRGERNSYYQRGNEAGLAPWYIELNRRLRMRYNVTAKRMGFRLMNPNDEAFVLRKKAPDSG